jgi:hypothetical protein
VTADHITWDRTGGTSHASIIERNAWSAAARSVWVMPSRTSWSCTSAAGVWRPYRLTNHDRNVGTEAKSEWGRLRAVTTNGSPPSGGW